MSAFTDLIDLAAARFGGRALACSDEFFAEKENLLAPERAVFVADKYTDRGKWMDGWESRRKRVPGHDWCVVQLGLPGVIRGFDIDTNHFIGNFPEHASVEGCYSPGAGIDDLVGAVWTELLPMKRLEGGAQNLHAIVNDQPFTHVRLHIYPDGGVARFRVHGIVRPDWAALIAGGKPVDLAATVNGGRALISSDQFFSHPDNLLAPGDSTHMGDGWETKRKRGPGHDWLIVRLGRPGKIASVEIDTTHFKGNFPDRCSLDGALLDEDVPDDFLVSRSLAWSEILPSVKLSADLRHTFENDLLARGSFSHVRVNIFPDGGLARLRLWGQPRP